jgi:ribosomal protein S18 acetylase RimI-like enzyme
MLDFKTIDSIDVKHEHPIVLTPVSEYKQIEDLKKLQSIIFPVSYNDKFYRDVINTHPEEFSRLVYHRDGRKSRESCVGALCCRLEWDDEIGALVDVNRPLFPPKHAAFLPVSTPLRVYIMTIGVLAPYRSMGIGGELMEYLFDVLRGSSGPRWNVGRVILHVHVGNDRAVCFYEKLGFIRKKLERDYYRRNRGVPDPPDAWKLEKTLQ